MPTWSLAAGVDLFTLSRRMGTSLARSTPPTGTWRRTPTSASERCSMPTISGRQRRALLPAKRFEMHDPNAAVVAILGSRGHDAHLLPV
ncbi:MAG TPA: hypothetical protein VIF85_09780, partial [Gaiellaceae bacterium]